MNIIESLKSLTAYPVPTATLTNICDEVGLDSQAAATSERRQAKAYKRAKALVYSFLSEAPNVSQGGISYSFSEDERSRFKKRAEAILKDIAEEDPTMVAAGGYIGEDF